MDRTEGPHDRPRPEAPPRERVDEHPGRGAAGQLRHRHPMAAAFRSLPAGPIARGRPADVVRAHEPGLRPVQGGDAAQRGGGRRGGEPSALGTAGSLRRAIRLPQRNRPAPRTRGGEGRALPAGRVGLLGRRPQRPAIDAGLLPGRHPCHAADVGRRFRGGKRAVERAWTGPQGRVPGGVPARPSEPEHDAIPALRSAGRQPDRGLPPPLHGQHVRPARPFRRL